MYDRMGIDNSKNTSGYRKRTNACIVQFLISSWIS